MSPKPKYLPDLGSSIASGLKGSGILDVAPCGGSTKRSYVPTLDVLLYLGTVWLTQTPGSKALWLWTQCRGLIKEEFESPQVHHLLAILPWAIAHPSGAKLKTEEKCIPPRAVVSIERNILGLVLSLAYRRIHEVSLIFDGKQYPPLSTATGSLAILYLLKWAL